jgi:peptide/nickel transport system permease protein
MLAYLVRKLLLTLSIVLGVVLLTFFLFNVVAKDPARAFAGKKPTKEGLESARHKMGLDKPKVNLNFEEYHNDPEHRWRDLFDNQLLNILTFQFPISMRYQESVWSLFARKAPVSLTIQGPAFVIGLGLQLLIAIIVASKRGSALDYSTTIGAVLLMSVPALSIYLGAQWLLAWQLNLFPVAGWATGAIFVMHFATLPILVSVFGGLGGGVRFFRTIALEEISSDYVRTARAKGVGQGEVLTVHVFRNLLIPLVTQTVVTLPFLVTGSLILEHMFQIPGFGGLLVDAIGANDSPVIMAEVYLTAIIYAVMLFATDICYALVDPRVKLR